MGKAILHEPWPKDASPSNQWFLGPSCIHIILISSAVFAGFTIVTDRQTMLL